VNLEKLGVAVGWMLAATTWIAGDVAARSRVEVRCATPNVVVHSAQHEDAVVACEGARDAMVFLASQGLKVGGPVTIDVVAALPSNASDSAAGCYLPAENRAVVLSFREFRKLRSWFEIEVDLDLYRSVVAHEVAHAIAAANFKVEKPAIQAHEYIAYVTMFATMDPAVRERALSNYPGSGFENDAQMSSTIYLFDPMRFGVQAWRHYLAPGGGRDYLHAVLAGRALTE
jgi:hypothetical protein